MHQLKADLAALALSCVDVQYMFPIRKFKLEHYALGNTVCV